MKVIVSKTVNKMNDKETKHPGVEQQPGYYQFSPPYSDTIPC